MVVVLVVADVSAVIVLLGVAMFLAMGRALVGVVRSTSAIKAIAD